MYRQRALSDRIADVRRSAVQQRSRVRAERMGEYCHLRGRVRLSELLDKAVRLRRHRENPLGYGHLDSRFSAEGFNRFVLGVPAGME
jgi:hypothetical protein